jgi:hypothetical protein
MPTCFGVFPLVSVLAVERSDARGLEASRSLANMDMVFKLLVPCNVELASFFFDATTICIYRKGSEFEGFLKTRKNAEGLEVIFIGNRTADAAETVWWL